MYSPTQGRFVTTDPIGFQAGDVNLYRFVGNNPSNATDPSGLQEKNPIVVDPGGTKYDLPKSENIIRWVVGPSSKAKLLKDVPFGRNNELLCPLDKKHNPPYIVSGDRGWAGVVPKGAYIGPDGCGPCVGVVLVPPEKGMKTYILHLSAGSDVSKCFQTVGFLEKKAGTVEVYGEGTVTIESWVPKKGYKAYICGAYEPAPSQHFKFDNEQRLHTLEDAVKFCRRNGVEIELYIPAPGFAVDENGWPYWSSNPSPGEGDRYEK